MSRFIRFSRLIRFVWVPVYVRLRYLRLRFRPFAGPLSGPPPSSPLPLSPPSPLPSGVPLPPRLPVTEPLVRPVALVLKFLSILVALTGLLLTFCLARSGHDTAGLVAVLSALVPLLVVVVRSR